MMFTSKQEDSNVENYKKLLGVMGSFSNLFSDSNVPYLSYRVSENLFCRSFAARNLSRSDVSADASKDKIGLSIKTFIEGNGSTLQKVAEFNRDRNLYKGKDPENAIRIISSLRNKRIEATCRIHTLDVIIYHLIVRSPGNIKVYEQNMDIIDASNIRDIEHTGNIIRFNDSLNEYSFNLSKSTLYKRFVTPDEHIEIPVNILEDPFGTLENILVGQIEISDLIFEPVRPEQEHIFLPLYSDRTNRVEERSGLNQWNAKGRPRDLNEAYIPIPSWIHSNFPNFFPARHVPFSLELPNGEVIQAKMCQGGRKALMSKPNNALGEWILRDVLDLDEGQLLTKEKLDEIGLDAVVIYKDSPGKYSINFVKSGRYEQFKNNLLA